MLQGQAVCVCFFFKQKTAYEMPKGLEFRRVLFRSEVPRPRERLSDEPRSHGYSTAIVEHAALGARAEGELRAGIDQRGVRDPAEQDENDGQAGGDRQRS